MGKPGNHHRPQTLRSKYPLWSPPDAPTPAPNKASVTTAPPPRLTGFDPETSRELPDKRDAYQRVYRNADGTQTTEFSTSPVNHRRPDGSWAPIDTRLVADRDGWRNAADAVSVRIAGRANAPVVARIGLDATHEIGFGLSGATGVPGQADHSTVTYREAYPGVDVRLESVSGGVKESLVLRSPQAARSYRFPLRLRGLTAAMVDDEVVFTDEAGTRRAVIPAGFMADADSAISYGVRYRLVDGALEMSLDEAWLNDPARRWPVLVDPSVATGAASSSMVVHGSRSSSGSDELLVGRSGGAAAASYLKFDGLVERLRGHTIYGVQLSIVNFDAPSCQPRPVTVHAVTQLWSVGSGYSYPGPSVGPALASESFAYGYFALGQSKSACPVKATLFDLGVAGRKLVQGWADGQPAYGLSLRASATDSGAWKRIAGSGTQNPPRLYVTHSPYNAKYSIPKPVPEPPVLQNQSGRVQVSVTNLSAEAWTPSGYYLAYRAYNAQTGRAVTQQRSANLPGTVARGAKVTLNAEIKPLPPGRYFIDFTMVRTGGVVFTDEQVPPARMVLEVVDIPPVVQEIFPPNGYQTPTLTPQLWARALDIDAPPGSNLRYKFEVCDTDSAGEPVNCTTSAYQNSPAWTVPAGRLSWSRTYLWRGFVADAGNEVPTPRSALLAAVPQPVVTSRVAGAPYGSQEREFDPQVGNYTTTAVDATVATVGPELTLVRTYNSLDPRRTGMFGAGWSSRYDMRLVPDGDGSGNVVVTYPDGQEVRFGRNPDGTYAAPAGRTAGLINDGTLWRLTDASGTTYTFANDGRLTRYADAAGRAVVLTYDTDGRLARAQVSNSQSNTAGRSLRFTWSGSRVSAVTDDAGSVWSYTYTGDLLTQVCAPGGACTSYTYTQGSHYRTAVLDDQPESYYRLGDDGTHAGSEVAVNLGKDAGTYVAATTGVAGALAGSADTAVAFNGISSRLDLPKGALKKSRDAAVELWFKATASGSGGPLIGYQDQPIGTASSVGVPVLYVGNDGRLRGQFGTGAVAPITSSRTVIDGQWHHVVLSVMAGTQTLYLDGVSQGSAPLPAGDASNLSVNQVGAAYASNPTAWPGWGATAQRFFNGAIDEVALYSHPLGPAAVAAHHRYGLQASDQLSTVVLPSGKTATTVEYDPATARVKEYTDDDGGTWRVGAPLVYGGDTDLRRGVEVRDPAGRLHLYEYDALAGRVIRTGVPAGLGLRDEDRPLPLSPSPTPSPSPTWVCSTPDGTDPGFCTTIPGDSEGPVFDGHTGDGMGIRTYSYDDNGFQNAITNENGDTVWMTHDSRGNVTSKKTCRTLGTDCHTEYFTYPAEPTNPYDPRNDLVIESRDGRSASATDTTYRTRFTYTSTGELASQTNPDGSVVQHTYTTGGESAVDGGVVPAGLPLVTTDARGARTRYAYYRNGDLARVTEPSGLVTTFTYDVLGRKISETQYSDSFPDGLTTTYTYDALSRPVSVTDPAAGGHQRRTTTTYDIDGNVVTESVTDALGDDPPRTTVYEYDEHNRVIRISDPEGNETSFGYDRFGNRTFMVDPLGNRFEYGYTARNMLAEVRLRVDDGSDDGADVVLASYAYDYAGRKVRETDAMGRDLVYAYYGDDLVRSVTLKNFHDPDGGTRDLVLESNTYDGAGNLIRRVAANGRMTVEHTYTRTGQIASTVVDPGGLSRRTAYTYDANGNVTRVSRGGGASNVPWPVSTAPEVAEFEYDLAGRMITETEIAGSATRVTSYRYDQRGLPISMTDPRGNTTTYTYDELGRQTSATGPEVEAGRPVSRVAYNTFGEPVAVTDPLGNVTRIEYDRLGRVVRTIAPTYTPLGGIPVNPTTETRYDAAGNVIEQIDPRGNSIRYTYDQFGRVLTRDAPGATGDERAVTRYTYTLTGEVLSIVDPTGARVEFTYDDLDRRITETVVERWPVTDNFTTRFTYDDASNLVSITSPTGAKTVNVFDALGQLVKTVDPAGVPTHFGYDAAGRQVRVTDAAGRTNRVDYDGFGAPVAESDLDASGTTLRTTSFRYDAGGNLISVTDPLGHTTTFSYDAAEQLVSQTEPGQITTSFGYDLAGNRTRYTDGRGNTTTFTYNSLGLLESVIEPATAAHPALADRTWTVSYDAAGNPVRQLAPGGVARLRTYDAAGRLATESGSGAEAETASRTFGYNLRGDLVSVSTPGGTDTFRYDDRGNLVAASGPSGNASFVYDADGDLLSRTDAAGTSRFTYRNGRLDTVTDGLSGTVQRYGYDIAGNVATIDYGSGRVRSYGYDAFGRLASDKLVNAAGDTVASITYEYDDTDHLIRKVTTGTAGAGTNTYSYDATGRLTSWTGPNGTVEYAWDASGNRIRAGTKTASYDERNRLLSDGDYTYEYTARGTLRSRTSSGLTERFSFDAFDRLITADETSYVYDGLDRVTSRDGTPFQYGGSDDAVVFDGRYRYAYGPDGDLLATARDDVDRLTLADKHGDVIGDFDPADTALTALADSTAYSPFGEVIAADGDAGGSLGFQGDWTDPETGQVNMGARWYDPGTGAFISRDDVTYSSGDSVLANRYVYGAAAPLDHIDPDGHAPCPLSPSCLWRKTKQTKRGIAGWIGSTWNKAINWGKAKVQGGWSVVRWLYQKAKGPVGVVIRPVKKLGRGLVKAASSGLKKIWRSTAPLRNYVKEKTAAAVHAAKAAKKKITRIARKAVEIAVKYNPIKVLAAAAKPLLRGVKTVIRSAARVAAQHVALVRDVVKDVSKGIKVLYQKAVDTAAEMISAVSTAVKATSEFVQDHAATIAGVAVGLAVGVGCGAAIGWTGVGAVACGALAGAAGAFVTGWMDGERGWDLVGTTLIGGAVGAFTGGLGSAAGSILGAGVRAVTGRVGARVAGNAVRPAAGAEARSAASGRPSAGKLGRVRASCPIPGANSFVPGTGVLMADGSRRAIENVTVGELVLATDPASGRTESRQVTDVIVGDGEKKLVEVATDGGTIVATEGHPFWVASLRRWVEAKDLEPGYAFETADHRPAVVTGVRRWSERTRVYNLTVDALHTYYVFAGDTAVLVHNASNNAAGCPPGLVPAGVQNLVDGAYMTTDDALETANQFLGPGYRDMGGGRFLSQDGLRQVRLTDADLAHPRQNPHINFETYNQPIGPGIRSGGPVSNIHIYLPQEPGWHTSP